MTKRLHAAAIFALLAVWPGLGALANSSDPLKLPGAEPKPVGAGKPVRVDATPAAAGTVSAVPAAGPVPSATADVAPPMSDAQRYCQNIAAAAADARFAWQSKKLAEAETRIKQRLADLDARQAEVRDILNRYNDALKRAKTALVDIYAKMKPETAALQIAAMDDGAAAAILSQLTAQKASAILNEIAPDRAVRLVTTMSALVPAADGKKS